MDLKGVQKQLKDDIAQHQILMKQLKSTPGDADLRKKLKEIQRHIAELGAVQKQISKEKTQDQNTTSNQEKETTELNLKNGLKKTLNDQDQLCKFKKELLNGTNSVEESEQKIEKNDLKNGETDNEVKVKIEKDNFPAQNEKFLLKKLPLGSQIGPMHGVRIVNGQVKIRQVPSTSTNTISPIVLIQTGIQVSHSNKTQIFRILPNFSQASNLKPQLLNKSINKINTGQVFLNNNTSTKSLLPAKLKQSRSRLSQKSPSQSPTFGFTASRRKSSTDKLSPTKLQNYSRRDENMLQDMQDIVPEKNMFLMQLGLVTNAKAAKFRTRRYGKRRTCANPIYSGGIYVSDTTNELNKRVLDDDVMEEDLPVKRPRGRPKGTGRKSPIQLQSGVKVSDEVNKIIEGLKPNNFPNERRSITPINSNSHEDSCTVCGEAGEVLMCDTCSRVYHRKCLIPPLKRTPTVMWICDQCKVKFSDVSTASQWPGLMSIVHSYFAYNSKREMALKEAQLKFKTLRTKKSNIQQKTKELTEIIAQKVNEKNLAKSQLVTNIELLRQINFWYKNIKFIVSKPNNIEDKNLDV